MDDDYVAQLMAKEAAENSKKYSLEGLGAYQSQKRSVNAPKANTRFLRHLIKETDSHNTALKRKEERDARDRMRQMKGQSSREQSSQRLSPAPGVHEGERHSSTRTSDRSHRDDRRHNSRRDDQRSDQNRSHRKSHRHRSRSPSSGGDRGRDRDRDRRHRRRDDDRSRSRDTHKDRERKTRRRDDDRDRSRERGRDKEYRDSRRPTTYRRRTYSESRSRSPRRDRSAEPHRSRRHHKSPSNARTSPSSRKEERRSRCDKDTRSSHESKCAASPDPVEKINRKSGPSIQRHDREESDPLEDVVGPLPPQTAAPVRSRGRGAYKANLSNIDSHFAPDYDPMADIQPDDDQSLSNRPTRRPVAGLETGEDDWDMALEALRDRARWKQKGEERLREAGLNETIIERWKDNTTSAGASGEKRPEDVRWSKKGEGREWDRGKVVDDQGHTDVHASW